MKKNLSAIFISLICVSLMFNQVFADSDTFTNFTDEDPDSLINITSSYNLSDIYYTVKKEAVIDSAAQSHIHQ